MNWRFWQKKKPHPLDDIIKRGDSMIFWGCTDDKGNDTSLKHGCGIIDPYGNLIDVTGQSDIKNI